MTKIVEMHVNKWTNSDGSRSVSARTHKAGWMPAGRVMAQVENHVSEQPTNKWKQVLIERQLKRLS